MKCRCLIAVITGWLLLISSAIQSAETDPDSSPADSLRLAAVGGNSNAQFELGNQYYRGEGRTINYTIAAHWFRRAARQNHPGAMFNLAISHEMGLGVVRSKYHAFQYYRQASDAGIREARFNLALSYISGIEPESHDGDKTPAILPDLQQAAELLKSLAENNFIPAKRELAGIYLDRPSDQRKPEETKQAFELLLEASASGDCGSMRRLADCYYAGWGCEQNNKKMIEWLTKAAAKNDPEAAAKLAFCYESGTGVLPNPEESFKYFSEAAKLGQAMAQYKMAEYCAAGLYTETDIPQSLEWLKK